MSAREAVLKGIRGAAELHEFLGLREKLKGSAEGVDIFRVINDFGLCLICKPLDGLLGVYLSGTHNGIMITTKRRLPIQRFTAAHELGHHYLGHGDSYDDEGQISLARAKNEICPFQEIEAEAFAAEFLLPKWLIVQIAKSQGWGARDLKNPQIAYQLSLRLGTSYESTKIALRNHGFLKTSAEVELLEKVEPRDLKRRLLRGLEADSWSDTFYLNKWDSGKHLHASPDDTVVLDLPENSAAGYQWVIESGTDDIQILEDKNQAEELDSGEVKFGAVSHRRLAFRGKDYVELKLKEVRTWEVKEPINTFNVSIDFYGKEEGFPRVARQWG